MNKKTLFLVLLADIVLFLPIIALAQTTALTTLVNNIGNVIWTVGVSLLIIGWIIAAFLYFLSFGSPEKMTTARRAVVAATIGTVLMVLAGASVGIYNLIRQALLRGI